LVAQAIDGGRHILALLFVLALQLVQQPVEGRKRKTQIHQLRQWMPFHSVAEMEAACLAREMLPSPAVKGTNTAPRDAEHFQDEMNTVESVATA
jgi:hypothetical protein